MYVTPDHAANSTVTIDDREELLRISKSDTIQPRAAHGYRLVMHTDQHVLIGESRQ